MRFHKAEKHLDDGSISYGVLDNETSEYYPITFDPFDRYLQRAVDDLNNGDAVIGLLVPSISKGIVGVM